MLCLGTSLTACSPAGETEEPAIEQPSPELTDVSAGDCAPMSLVYDRPPESRGHDLGVPFINDLCSGDAIAIGLGGERRTLNRDESGPLGTASAYTDGSLRVSVRRGDLAWREELDYTCGDGDDAEFEAVYAASVLVESSEGAWEVAGSLQTYECAGRM